MGSVPTSVVLCPGVRHVIPRKILVMPRKLWLRPDMTEKLLTGAFNFNLNEQDNINIYVEGQGNVPIS